MPGWHDAIKGLYESGELQVAGIIQEQHPDRCRLFMQWKQMDWPILVDSLNLLEVSAVPITVAIDEHGIVRHKGLRLDKVGEFRREFLAKNFAAPEPAPVKVDVPTQWPSAAPAPEGSDAVALAKRATDIVLAKAAGPAGDAIAIDEAIASYEKAVQIEPDNGWTHFRLGVALRMRYDSPARQPGDFQAAIDQWKAALDIDPNQYIWRRRIQQYGARLDKPYPFYDWVPQARADILARGEQPAPLNVEPGGAEFAAPARELVNTTGQAPNPDPEGRIHRDENEFVAMETVAAPASLKPGEATRVHVLMQPVKDRKAHWNNEAEGTELWLDAPDGCQADSPYRLLDNPPQAVSLEDRRAEFELHCKDDTAPGNRKVSGYALYYVCEDVNGVCLYRRQDFSLALDIRQP